MILTNVFLTFIALQFTIVDSNGTSRGKYNEEHPLTSFQMEKDMNYKFEFDEFSFSTSLIINDGPPNDYSRNTIKSCEFRPFAIDFLLFETPVKLGAPGLTPSPAFVGIDRYIYTTEESGYILVYKLIEIPDPFGEVQFNLSLVQKKYVATRLDSVKKLLIDEINNKLIIQASDKVLIASIEERDKPVYRTKDTFSKDREINQIQLKNSYIYVLFSRGNHFMIVNPQTSYNTLELSPEDLGLESYNIVDFDFLGDILLLLDEDTQHLYFVGIDYLEGTFTQVRGPLNLTSDGKLSGIKIESQNLFLTISYPDSEEVHEYTQIGLDFEWNRKYVEYTKIISTHFLKDFLVLVKSNYLTFYPHHVPNDIVINAKTHQMAYGKIMEQILSFDPLFPYDPMNNLVYISFRNEYYIGQMKQTGIELVCSEDEDRVAGTVNATLFIYSHKCKAKEKANDTNPNHVCKIKKPVEIIFVSDFMTGGSIKYVIAGLVIMVIALLVFAIAFFRKYKKLTRRYEKLKQALDRPNHLELSENSSSTNEIFSFPSSRRSSIELPKLEDCEAQYIGHEDFLDKDHSA